MILFFSGCAFNLPGSAEKVVVYQNRVASIRVVLVKKVVRVNQKLRFKITVISNDYEKKFYLPFELELFKGNRRLAKLKKSFLINKYVKTFTIKLPVKKGLKGKYSYEFTFLKHSGFKKEGSFTVK